MLATNGNIPYGAVPGGHDGDHANETLYIGRTIYKGSMIPGKVINFVPSFEKSTNNR